MNNKIFIIFIMLAYFRKTKVILFVLSIIVICLIYKKIPEMFTSENDELLKLISILESKKEENEDVKKVISDLRSENNVSVDYSNELRIPLPTLSQDTLDSLLQKYTKKKNHVWISQIVNDQNKQTSRIIPEPIIEKIPPRKTIIREVVQ